MSPSNDKASRSAASESGMFRFACPNCGKRLKAKPETAGRTGKCQSCGHRLRVPEPASMQNQAADVAPAEKTSAGGSQARAPEHGKSFHRTRTDVNATTEEKDSSLRGEIIQADSSDVEIRWASEIEHRFRGLHRGAFTFEFVPRGKPTAAAMGLKTDSDTCLDLCGDLPVEFCCDYRVLPAGVVAIFGFRFFDREGEPLTCEHLIDPLHKATVDQVRLAAVGPDLFMAIIDDEGQCLTSKRVHLGDRLRKAADDMLTQAAATAQDLTAHDFALAQAQYSESFQLGHMFTADAASGEEIVDAALGQATTDDHAERTDGDLERLQADLRGPNGALQPAGVNALLQSMHPKARGVLFEEFKWSDGDDRYVLAEALAETDFPEVIRHFGTETAEKALELADSYGQEHGQVSAAHHLLLALARLGEGVGANVLKNLDVDMTSLSRDISRLIAAAPKDFDASGGTLGRVVKAAVQESRAFRHYYVGTEHLLLALLGASPALAAVLTKHGINSDDARNEVSKLLGLGIENGDHTEEEGSTQTKCTSSEAWPLFNGLLGGLSPNNRSQVVDLMAGAIGCHEILAFYRDDEGFRQASQLIVELAEHYAAWRIAACSTHPGGSIYVRATLDECLAREVIRTLRKGKHEIMLGP